MQASDLSGFFQELEAAIPPHSHAHHSMTSFVNDAGERKLAVVVMTMPIFLCFLEPPDLADTTSNAVAAVVAAYEAEKAKH